MENEDFGKMNPVIKAKWVAALRSGDYEQGHNYLKITREGYKNGAYPSSTGIHEPQAAAAYCCLGVVCEVVGIKRNLTSKWLGGSAREQISLTSAAETKLISLNDTEGATFTQIADWIEANL
jgi:hypothetical protein